MQRERGRACLLCITNNEEFTVSKTNKANTRMTWCLCCAVYGYNNERRPEISHSVLNNEAKIGGNRSIDFSSPHCFSFFHNYEGINNLKHVHLHLSLLLKITQSYPRGTNDHFRIIPRYWSDFIQHCWMRHVDLFAHFGHCWLMFYQN